MLKIYCLPMLPNKNMDEIYLAYSEYYYITKMPQAQAHNYSDIVR